MQWLKEVHRNPVGEETENRNRIRGENSRGEGVDGKENRKRKDGLIGRWKTKADENVLEEGKLRLLMVYSRLNELKKKKIIIFG